MKFDIPDLGELSVGRNGEDGPGHYKWKVRATLPDGSALRTWGTCPTFWDVQDIFGWACDCIGTVVEERTGNITGNAWSLLADDIREGRDRAAFYAISTLWWRVQPYTYAPDGDTYRTIGELESAWKRGYLRAGYPDAGDVLDLYRNDDDEPTIRLIMGPRGGVTRVSY